MTGDGRVILYLQPTPHGSHLIKYDAGAGSVDLLSPDNPNLGESMSVGVISGDGTTYATQYRWDVVSSQDRAEGLIVKKLAAPRPVPSDIIFPIDANSNEGVEPYDASRNGAVIIFVHQAAFTTYGSIRLFSGGSFRTLTSTAYIITDLDMTDDGTTFIWTRAHEGGNGLVFGDGVFARRLS